MTCSPRECFNPWWFLVLRVRSSDQREQSDRNAASSGASAFLQVYLLWFDMERGELLRLVQQQKDLPPYMKLHPWKHTAVRRRSPQRSRAAPHVTMLYLRPIMLSRCVRCPPACQLQVACCRLLVCLRPAQMAPYPYAGVARRDWSVAARTCVPDIVRSRVAALRRSTAPNLWCITSRCSTLEALVARPSTPSTS